MFASDGRLAKVQFRMAVIDADGQLTGATKPISHLSAPIGEMSRAELSFPFDIPWLPGGGTAFRMEAMRRILPIPEADYPRCGADWYLVHLSALLGSAAALDDVCAEYRAHVLMHTKLDRPELDLAHVRDSIAYASTTTAHLSRLANEMGIEHDEPILSVSDLANRLVSVKLEPDSHPVAGVIGPRRSRSTGCGRPQAVRCRLVDEGALRLLVRADGRCAAPALEAAGRALPAAGAAAVPEPAAGRLQANGGPADRLA